MDGQGAQGKPAWWRGRGVRQHAITVVLMAHFSVVLFNNLPHTAFTFKVDDAYLWYLNLTGQYQTGWGMYGTPTRLNDHFQLKIYNTDQPDQDYRYLEIGNARELYLVEALAFAGEPLQTHLARAYLTYKEQDLELTPSQRIELHRYSASFQPGFDDVTQPTTVWQLEAPEDEEPASPATDNPSGEGIGETNATIEGGADE